MCAELVLQNQGGVIECDVVQFGKRNAVALAGEVKLDWRDDFGLVFPLGRIFAGLDFYIGKDADGIARQAKDGEKNGMMTV